MKEYKVSIIVPVYNVEEYIEDCLKSVCNQTYHNLEIIVVDDGSTDGSSQICKRMSKLDNRIIYIRQDNSGVSAARNNGIERASGKYVVFVDADDLLMHDGIEKLVKAEAGTGKMVISGYCCISENNNIVSYNSDYLVSELDNSSALAYVILKNKLLEYQGYLWNKLFSNEIIRQRNLRFTEDIAYNEDRLFIVQYLLSGCDVTIISDVVYQYRLRNGSAMNTLGKGFTANQLSELKAFEIIEELVKKCNSSIYVRALQASLYCAINLYKRIPGNDIYVNESEYTKKVINKRILTAVFGRSRYITIKDRLKCLYYYMGMLLKYR